MIFTEILMEKWYFKFLVVILEQESETLNVQKIT